MAQNWVLYIVVIDNIADHVEQASNKPFSTVLVSDIFSGSASRGSVSPPPKSEDGSLSRRYRNVFCLTAVVDVVVVVVVVVGVVVFEHGIPLVRGPR